mgnify:CR=1 FL=1
MRPFLSTSLSTWSALLAFTLVFSSCTRDNDLTQSVLSSDTKVRAVPSTSVPAEVLERTEMSRSNAIRAEFLKIDVEGLASSSNFSLKGASSILPFRFGIEENRTVTSVDEIYDMETQQEITRSPEEYQVIKFHATDPGMNEYDVENYSRGLFLASMEKQTIIGNIQVGGIYTRILPMNDEGLHLLLQTRVDRHTCDTDDSDVGHSMSAPETPANGGSRAVDNIKVLLAVSSNSDLFDTYSSNLTSLGTYTKNFLEDIYDSNESPNDITFTVQVFSVNNSNFDDDDSGDARDAFKSVISFLRDYYNCDLAAYIAPSSVPWTGRGEIGVSTDDWASVQNEDDAFSYYTLAHEIGHNFGMRLIRPNDSNSYCGHGYTFLQRVVANGNSGGSWSSTGERSVMAYGSTQFSSSRVPEFSDPSRNYSRYVPVRPRGGRRYYRFGMSCSSPGGSDEVNGSADNDKRIKDFKSTIAGFQ